MLLPGCQHGHHRLVDPGALPVPEGTHDLPLNHMLPQRPLRPVVGGLNTGNDEEGKPVGDAVPHLSGELSYLLGLVGPPRPLPHQGPRLLNQPLRLPGGRPVLRRHVEAPVHHVQCLRERPRLVYPIRKVPRLPEEMGPAPLDAPRIARVRPPAIADHHALKVRSQDLSEDLLAPALPDARARAVRGLF